MLAIYASCFTCINICVLETRKAWNELFWKKKTLVLKENIFLHIIFFQNISIPVLRKTKFLSIWRLTPQKMSISNYLALTTLWLTSNLNGGRRTDILLLNLSLTFLLIWDIHHTALSIFNTLFNNQFYIIIFQHR